MTDDDYSLFYALVEAYMPIMMLAYSDTLNSQTVGGSEKRNLPVNTLVCFIKVTDVGIILKKMSRGQ